MSIMRKECLRRMWSRFFFTPDVSSLQNRQILKDSNVVLTFTDDLLDSEFSSTCICSEWSDRPFIERFRSERKSEPPSN